MVQFCKLTIYMAHNKQAVTANSVMINRFCGHTQAHATSGIVLSKNEEINNIVCKTAQDEAIGCSVSVHKQWKSFHTIVWEPSEF